MINENMSTRFIFKMGYHYHDFLPLYNITPHEDCEMYKRCSV